MKLTRSQLRKLIMEMAMLNPSEASVDLALAHDASVSYDGMRHFILFDPSQAQKSLMKAIKTNQMYELPTDKRAVLGAITNATLAVMEVKDNNGLWEGKRVAAEKGYGPTMYELMMMLSPAGFMSDRTGYSSADTHPVWDKYMARARNGEVELKSVPEEFKIENAGSEWQDHVFKIQDDGSAFKLKSNYDSFLLQAQTSTPELARINLKQELYLRGIVDEMFGQKYSEAGYFGYGEDY